MAREEKKWIITFSNGYCGCEQEEEFEGTHDSAVDFAEDYLQEYAEQYAYVAFDRDWEEDENIAEEDMDIYLENCSYDIKESDEEE